MNGGRLLGGLFVIALGVVFLLRSFGIIDFTLGELFRIYWPVLLIGLGLQSGWGRGVRNRPGGPVLILLGLLFLGRNLGWCYFSYQAFWRLFWPGLLILAGLNLLLGRGLRRPAHPGRPDGAVTGPAVIKSRSYQAVLGSLALDLRNESFPEGETFLSFTAVMGGIELLVPPDLAVRCTGTAVLGGLEFFERSNGGIIAGLDSERGDPEGPRKLRIDCVAVMGGVKVSAGP